MTNLSELVRDVGCRRDLLWRCDLAGLIEPAAFVDALLTEGFADVGQTRRFGLVVLEEPASGHRVVVVLRTGRVQLRMDASCPHAARTGESQRLHAVLDHMHLASPSTAGTGA